MRANNSIFRKTARSKVALIKNYDFIEIFIPSVGFFSRLAISNLILLILPTHLISFVFILFSYRDSSFLIPVFILLSVISLITLFIILLCEFGQKRLYITRKEISFIYELFWIKFRNPQLSLRQDILSLEIKKDTFNRHYLTIWVGRQKYEILTGESYIFSVTNPELDWLSDELSDWLGLPITYRS